MTQELRGRSGRAECGSLETDCEAPTLSSSAELVGPIERLDRNVSKSSQASQSSLPAPKISPALDAALNLGFAGTLFLTGFPALEGAQS